MMWIFTVRLSTARLSSPPPCESFIAPKCWNLTLWNYSSVIIKQLVGKYPATEKCYWTSTTDNITRTTGRYVLLFQPRIRFLHPVPVLAGSCNTQVGQSTCFHWAWIQFHQSWLCGFSSHSNNRAKQNSLWILPDTITAQINCHVSSLESDC